MNNCLWSLVIVLLSTLLVQSHPLASPQTQQALQGMKLIPQWHCLRYRKYDLVRRCRNFRSGRRY
ncbi:uncharacterized protein LOC143916052 [Arctopsyche grandis]|uniref:uncharacterized protein LOC143916052 n=1 Tax=Arctopsyche grandis TaxID=121162 RepID=UPI00406D9E38